MGPTAAEYQDRLKSGELEADAAQAAAVVRLDSLAAALCDWRPKTRGLFSVLRGNSGRQSASPRGLYIYGDVGRGKTMLMDLFYETVAFPSKRRLHFHEFMSEAHERIGRGRATTDGDPIPFVAQEMAAESALLCFDELQVTDIADAMILSRLFKYLLSDGVIVVATSNTEPRNLYRDGLNRNLFLPFIDLVEAHTDIFALQSAKDFRLDKLAGRPLYFTPADAKAHNQLDAHWQRLTGGHPATTVDLSVKGRKVHVPQAAMGVARFAFADLCEQPLGASDYLHIAHTFHTVLLDEIPVLGPERRNEARRFITLIDALYDNHVCVIASAEAEPDALYVSGDGVDAFARTVSRLMEMRSEAYVARAEPD
ncbi:MAG: AFG1 family ATPase [Alphaproteobacteria bacterium]|nr:AFG1 family ATPase [Alphaproteobacteria bacterium]